MNPMLEAVQSGSFDPVKMFSDQKNTLFELKSEFKTINKETQANLLFTKIIPTIFDKNVETTVRDQTLEMGFELLKNVNISDLERQQQDTALKDIDENYIKVIGDFRDENYQRWDKLWIFLIQLCKEKIHWKMSLANKLLRIVEVAFRNSTSVEQRLKAYDCWIELIDNSSLNMEHMCSAKQIKLLITPLKAKFSRMPVVIIKRCDTFVYLLAKLKDKATLCLKEFLEFCFGPFNEKNDVEKMKHGRSVPEVCSKSTKLLLEIIGHSHDKSVDCFFNNDLGLETALINHSNFREFSDILIFSVIECCVLLNEWCKDVSKNETVVKCLWQSLLQFINKSERTAKEKSYNQVKNCLKNMQERCKFNENCYKVMSIIIEVIIKDEIIQTAKDVIFDNSLQVLLHCPLSVDVENFIFSSLDSENLSDANCLNLFKYNSNCENPVLCDIWLRAKFFIVFDSVSVMIWPIRHLQKFEDIDALKTKWIKLYTSECKNEMKILLLQEIEKLYAENPLLNSNVVQCLEWIAKEEINGGKEFVAKFMKLIEVVLTLPNLPETNVKKLSTIVSSYFKQNHSFYKNDTNDEAVGKLCSCIQYLISVHKEYSILNQLTLDLKNSQPKIRAKFSSLLLTSLESLMLNDDLTVISTVRKLIELLESKENECDTLTITPSRSLRLLNMATPKAQKSIKFKVFGKDTSSTPSLRSSTPKTKTNGCDDDKSSDYVKIDSEVKLNVDNLNDHQKEMLKRRREDIPALYQDLTQSQSQDIFKQASDIDTIPPNVPPSLDKEIEELQLKRKRSNSDEINENIKIAKISEDDLPKTNSDVSSHNAQVNTDSSVVTSEEIIGETSKSSEEKSPGTVEKKTKKRYRGDNTYKYRKRAVSSRKRNKEVKQSTKKTVASAEQKVEEGATEQKLSEEATEQKIAEEVTEKKLPEETTEQTVTEETAEHKITEESKEDKTEEFTPPVEEENVISDTISESQDIVRKSKRQVRKRKDEFMISPVTQTKRGRRSKQVTEVNETDEKEIEKLNGDVEDTSKSRKRHKRVKDKTTEDSEEIRLARELELESIEDLLSRIDKRIEEKKKKTRKHRLNRTWNGSDGNQNAIIPEKKIATVDSVKSKQVKEKSLKRDPSLLKKVKKRLTSSDIFDFESDKEETTEVVKKTKKKIIRLSLKKNDLVHSKRKKNKTTKEDFHVTADSPVPLCKSPLLRAVPSPQESETITILITRSPPETPNENVAKPKRSRRKIPQSQDVIESSQKMKLRSPAKLRQRTIDDMMKPKLSESFDFSESQTPESNKNETKPKIVSTRRFSLTELPSETVLRTRKSRSKSLDKLDYNAGIVHFSEDRQKSKEEKDSDELPDTLTLKTNEECVSSETPSKAEAKVEDDLPCSPITFDTPDRAAELLNSTSDISPISSQEDIATPVLKHSNNASNVRVARLLQLANSNVQVKNNDNKWFGTKFSSPSTSRVRKMRMKKEENLDVLTFSREVPSPLTLPPGGILKRKLGSIDEIATPSPKRKRVNFSDPETTEKLIYFKDNEEDEEKDDTNQIDSSSYNDDDQNSKDSCDEEVRGFNLKRILIDDPDYKESLKRLLESLKVPEVVNIFAEYMSTVNSDTIEELKVSLTQSGSSQKISDQYIVPIVESMVDCEEFLPKLLKIIEKQPEEKQEVCRKEIMKVFGTRILENGVEDMREQQAEEEILRLQPDKMNDLIKKFADNLEDAEKGEFFTSLMKMASNELPVKKFGNCYVELLQSFIQRVTD